MDHCIEVGNYLVDVNALACLEHRCDPALCRDMLCCCRVYDVWLDADDRSHLIAELSYASTWTGIKAQDADSCMRWVGAGYVLRKGGDGVCILARRAEDGRILCSLHLAALHRSVPPELHKPRSCAMWPLSLSGAGNRVLSVQQDAYNFPCNRCVRTGRAQLHPGTASLISKNFGEEFTSILREKVES